MPYIILYYNFLRNEFLNYIFHIQGYASVTSYLHYRHRRHVE